MLHVDNISFSIKVQQFLCNAVHYDSLQHCSVLPFASNMDTADVKCPDCGGSVHIYSRGERRLKDMPFIVGIRSECRVALHRYRCQQCGKTFTEDCCMRYHGTDITVRAAHWVTELLSYHIPIKAVHEITGISCDTIRRIHKEMMLCAICERKEELRLSGYKPVYIAVDEFAIKRGRIYGTCVIDLDTGDVIWVGLGKSAEDFSRFFKETDMEYLSEVKAVAMDMNASYNLVIRNCLPKAEIVYDRYHFQAKYGKDVFNRVRLSEAAQYKNAEDNITACWRRNIANAETKHSEYEIYRRRELRAGKNEQRSKRKTVKALRWVLLRNNETLSQQEALKLQEILSCHEDLAVCYAMKEELCRMFSITDPAAADRKWHSWFDAAKASGIKPLVNFARLMEKRLPGLIAHAKHPISTGKLEGFNNKIKVAKRIGYGYRNMEYFFTLIKYMSLPAVRKSYRTASSVKVT